MGETAAGADGLLLSPDGRYLAGLPWLEGSHWVDSSTGATAVVDLTSGEIKEYDGGLPVA